MISPQKGARLPLQINFGKSKVEPNSSKYCGY